jgi:hypothetical protein
VRFGSFASLRDALVGREVACATRGCDRTWLWSKEEITQANARGQTQPPKRTCESCEARLRSLAPREAPCARPGCSGTRAFSVNAQLDAWLRAGRPAEDPAPPPGLCAACQKIADERSDLEAPCRLRGCDGKWLFTARAQAQLAAETGELAPTPPKRLCARCESELKQLSDQPVPCRVRACTRHWTWSRFSQLEARRAGRADAAPPSRMCEPCASELKGFADRELPCRVRGCKNTFVYSARAQLEAHKSGADPSQQPKRMCASCAEKLSALSDTEVACKRPGCTRNWTWKRGAQLTAKRARAPRRFCDACEAELGKLADREIPCENEGCTGTWTWNRVAQLLAGRGKPPRHMCGGCTEFLASAQPKDIPCTRCGKAIHWAKQNQLQTKLGRWVEPTLCGSCKLSPG